MNTIWQFETKSSLGSQNSTFSAVGQYISCMYASRFEASSTPSGSNAKAHRSDFLEFGLQMGMSWLLISWLSQPPIQTVLLYHLHSLRLFQLSYRAQAFTHIINKHFTLKLLEPVSTSAMCY